MIRVIIADDHQIFLYGLSKILELSENFVVVGQASNGQDLLDILSENTVDIVMMDIEMPVMNGIETSMKIRREFPLVKICILSSHSDSQYVARLMQIGVDGILFKEINQGKLKLALETIYNEGTYFDQRVMQEVLTNFNKPKKRGGTALTPREKEITTLIADGLNSSEIAERLFLSPLTVETHRKNIFSKMGVKNVAMLIRQAQSKGII